MERLNLVYPEKSEIKYKISKFPDGQRQVSIVRWKSKDNTKWWDCHGVQVVSRLNNFQDLELIICAVKSLRNLGVKGIKLFTPYFLGSRSDKQFEDGSNNYLKDVICPIINSLNFESVIIRDPHSDVLEACLSNFEKFDNVRLVGWSLNKISNIHKNIDDVVLFSPDAGATKKIYKVAERIGYKEKIVTCSKDRDADGKITKCVVPFTDGWRNKNLIIIDDICDGGATFINIAKEIKTRRTNKIYLIVTHGIFSKGFEELNKYFDGIYCTNSYSDISDKCVKQLNLF